MEKKKWGEYLWDGWCILSGIGIWPRYIEPNLLSVSRLVFKFPVLHPSLDGLKILQFSDLHWDCFFSPTLRKKLTRKVNALNPDLIFFTGDFLSYSKLENPEGLKEILNSFKAVIGCFAVLGNHDYARFVTVNSEGDYAVEPPSSSSTISKGFKRLFQKSVVTGKFQDEVRGIGRHEELIALLKETPFQLLNNETHQLSIRGAKINICGLEEYSLGRCDPEKAFQGYDTSAPGIILSHNPDSLKILKNYPGDIILLGHTHGGQVNLPGFWRRFTRIEDLQFKQGLKKIGSKRAYINRGISSVMKFRWFAPPELTVLTLARGEDE